MENNQESERVAAARETLNALDQDRARAASRVRAPIWYQVAFALVIVTFIGAFSLDESAFMVAIVLCAVIGSLLGIIRPRVTGTQAEPWAHGPTSRWGIANFLALLIIGIAGVASFTATGLTWVLWISAVLAGATYLWLSRRMEDAFAQAVRQNR